MRCDEWQEVWLLLAYDETDDAQRAQCEEHLAGCAACRAEWTALRATQRFLDLVPERTSQVDLAALCLRFSARDRRRQVAWRWGVGAAVAAATVAMAMSLRVFRVEIEPGRMIVAWRAPVPALVEVPQVPQQPDGGATSPNSTAQEANSRQMDHVEPRFEPLAFAEFGDLEMALADGRSGVFTPQGGRTWSTSAATRFQTPQPSAPAEESAAGRALTTSHNDLRRELLERNQGLAMPRSFRGA